MWYIDKQVSQINKKNLTLDDQLMATRREQGRERGEQDKTGQFFCEGAVRT